MRISRGSFSGRKGIYTGCWSSSSWLRSSCGCFLRRSLFSRLEKDLVGTAYEVATLVREPSLALRHLVPDAAQGVVREELDDIARSEELVAYRQFAAIARRRRFLAHLPTFFLRIVVLIDPANRFIFSPECFDVRVIDQVQQRQQRRFTGK